MSGPSDPAALRRLGEELVSACAAEDATLRLLGGVAVALRCPSARDAGPLARSYSDLDAVTVRKDSRRLAPGMAALGFEPAKRFNAAHGAERMRFDLDDGIHIDVFVDRFRMCHELPLAGRLDRDDHTITLADLLLTKLQVAKLNEKDLTDIGALLLDHALGTGAGEIDLEYICGLLGDDWGWWRTTTETLSLVELRVDELPLAEAERERVRTQLATIRAEVEARPKSVRWRMRSRVGDRRSWREDPEDMEG